MTKVAIYLKLISEATRELTRNQGTYRRDIWQYLVDIYGKYDLDYRDFLHSIRRLQDDGKILND